MPSLFFIYFKLARLSVINYTLTLMSCEVLNLCETSKIVKVLILSKKSARNIVIVNGARSCVVQP